MACVIHRVKRCFRGFILIFFVTVALSFWTTAPARQGESASMPPVEGVVVNIAEIGSDFFVQLDLDFDGEGDVWVKIVAAISDVQGNALSEADIQISVRLRVMEYQESEAGFLEATIVVVVSDVADDNGGNNDTENVVTLVNIYARLVGAPRPGIELFGREKSAWVCLGEPVQLYWVTTPDVGLISLGEDLGTFPADRGGVINGLHWGTVTVTPSSTTSFQIFALDGNFESGEAATVRVFGDQPGVQIFEEGTLEAELSSSNSARTDELDDWTSEMPTTRFSQNIQVTQIKPISDAASNSSIWQVRKIDGDGTLHAFSLVALDQYQQPFAPDTFPVSGTWTFSTRANIVSTDLQFKVRTVCE